MKVIYTIINQATKANGELWFKLVLNEEDHLLIESARETALVSEFEEDKDYYYEVSKELVAEDQGIKYTFRLDLRAENILKLVENDNDIDYWETPEFYISKCNIEAVPLDDVLFKLIIGPIQHTLSKMKSRYKNQIKGNIYKREQELPY